MQVLRPRMRVMPKHIQVMAALSLMSSMIATSELV